MKKDLRIGVLLGGTSAEREVSLMSGAAVSVALRELGYDVVDIDAGADLCARLTEERVELAFIALHGGTGEDGSVQGLLEVMGIPYTGSGVLASAVAMDKVLSKTLFARAGIMVPEYEVIAYSDADTQKYLLEGYMKTDSDASVIAGYMRNLNRALKELKEQFQ